MRHLVGLNGFTKESCCDAPKIRPQKGILRDLTAPDADFRIVTRCGADIVRQPQDGVHVNRIRQAGMLPVRKIRLCL